MHILVVIGTRPEAIKLAPVIRRLYGSSGVRVRVCLTGQHRELLAQGLADFHIEVDHNLDLMEDGQSVNDVAARVMTGLSAILLRDPPDWVVVQGDTSSAMAAALTAFHLGLRVAHVEAGLRTGNRNQPWPEEINRRLIAQIAHLHLAPTLGALRNLEREGIASSTVAVCGNTVIDALILALEKAGDGDGDDEDSAPEGPLVLCTLHRRENLRQDRLRQVEAALKTVADELGCRVVIPLHPNPALAETAARLRAAHPRLRVVAPMNYVPFVKLMSQASLILTDSGGIQEEAAFLGKPLLIMRTATERPEVLDAGAILVGTDHDAIVHAVKRILRDPAPFRHLTGDFAALGTGGASAMIVEHLLSEEGRPP